MDASEISFIAVAGRTKFVQLLSDSSGVFPRNAWGELFGKSTLDLFKCFVVVKPFLDAETTSKFVVSSDIPTASFKKVIPISMIPKEYCGLSDIIVPIPLHAQPKAKEDTC